MATDSSVKDFEKENALGPESEIWEELSVPPEVILSSSHADKPLFDESINLDTVEIAQETTCKVKVCWYSNILLFLIP